MVAGQQQAQLAYSVPDLFNQEAEASDSAGIHKYSEDLIRLIVPDRAGKAYINLLSDRVAGAEVLAREGKNLIPETDVVRSFNDLMKKIGAPPSFQADKENLRKFRATSITVPHYSALISANRNGTNCNPGEAVFLLYLLISNNGKIPEHLLNELEISKRSKQSSGNFSTLVTMVPAGANSQVYDNLKNADAHLLLLSYASRHHRHATIKLFNSLTKALNF
jgi:hypothetical protein